MSEKLKTASKEAGNTEEKSDKETATDSKIAVKLEILEEKKKEDRPGVCCGSCT